jgi:diguanylate cyclase (GGDEF)-like protein
MAITYTQKKHRQNNIIYTVVTAILICAVFLSMIGFFYRQEEEEAYEALHIQTRQIKDDLALQIKSDRENLFTMAHFASQLYADGENYDRMFDSFEPIGLFSAIGILNPDNTFLTKVGSIDLSGKISFEQEALRGEYISGRVPDLTSDDGREIVRSAVPINVNGETVGILYGVIKLDVINKKYNEMARELDAQLFVYDNENGNYIIKSIGERLGNISELETRRYNDGYSYEDIVCLDKGYSSFESIYGHENLYAHWSTIEDIDWRIMLARYESQVFANTHIVATAMIVSFCVMIFIVIVYFLAMFHSEKRDSFITRKASEIRKLLLEVSQQKENIRTSLKEVMKASDARSAMFVDIENEEHNFINPRFENVVIRGEERKYFISELFRYAVEMSEANRVTLTVMSIKPNKHLLHTNRHLYEIFKKYGIKLVTFAAITSNTNNTNTSLLVVVNPKRKYCARSLVEDIAVCFSIAVYNKNYLNRTYTAATTDSLTGVSNRVAYKKDLIVFDEEKPSMFSCIYVDVNELHLMNNKYGHAAGDEMLIFIANALRSVFFGQSIYRMGGDEFLVFVKNTDQETVKRCIDVFTSQLDSHDYHVAIGISHRLQNTDTEEMVREAEKRMYEAKAQYYQNKEQTSVSESEDKSYSQIRTGIPEVDTMISVLKEHYNGIYRVNLESDTAKRILMPSHLGYKENEENFSKHLAKYIDETVHTDFHRAVISFLNYDAIKRQFAEGKTPKITYKRVNGESVILTVYKLDATEELVNDTLWVFAKD